MAKQHISVPVPYAKVTPVAPANKGFTLVKIYVCSPGKNRNFSHISKEELDAAIPTLGYIPVVGHLMEKVDKDGNVVGYIFGGHDVELTEDWELRDLTVPYGVVTTDAPFYETVMEFGKEKEYMIAYAYLWTGRYPEILDAKYSEDIWCGQSMEIDYDNWTLLDDDSNYVDLHGLEFSALCMLGKSDDPSEHVEPCFPNARIEPVKFDLGNNQFNQLMAEMREQLGHCFEMNATKEGGNESLNQEMIDAIFAEFGIAIDTIDFEITEDMTEEQLRAALEAFAAGDPDPAPAEGAGDEPHDEPADEPTDGPTDDPADPTEPPAEDDAPTSEFAAKFATANQKRDALRNALDPIVTRDAQGNFISEISYWVCDFDDNYVFVERNLWTMDDYECKNGRFAYTFDDATMTASITGEFEEMVTMWLTLSEAAKLEAERNELEVLRKFKADAEADAFSAQVEEIKADFEDVSGLEEFSSIVENVTDLDVMKMQLFALRGKQVKVKKVEKPVSTVRVALEDPASDNNEPYGGLFAKYGFGKKN